jgi:hypothetical protein
MFILGNLLALAILRVPAGAHENPLPEPKEATAVLAAPAGSDGGLHFAVANRGATTAIAALDHKDWLRGQAPSVNILQRVWRTAEAMQPDVSMGQVPGHGGVRLTLSVNALAFIRR